jgi:hypothetical protein
MSASRAAIRLWVFGTVFWIGFWGWNDLHKCLTTAKRVLFCPVTTTGDTLVRTDYLHVFYFIFGPSLVSLLGGLFCWWLILRLQRRLGSEQGYDR